MTIKPFRIPLFTLLYSYFRKVLIYKKITVNHTYPLIHISDLQFHGYMVDYLISTMT